MTSSSKYKVSVGSIARTLLYEDSDGTIRFTFDIDTSKTEGIIILELPRKNSIHTSQERFNLAVERVRQYLLSRGYRVDIFTGEGC